MTFSFHDLERIIAQRAASASGSSYTSSLINKGVEKIAQKMGEEAVETIIAAVSDNKTEIVKESADLMYHWLVLLNAANIPLDAVLNELETRTRQSGLSEKASRGYSENKKV
jgi:phosphoribosyl-ATP pyrophosphohydrolase